MEYKIESLILVLVVELNHLLDPKTVDIYDRGQRYHMIILGKDTQIHAV